MLLSVPSCNSWSQGGANQPLGGLGVVQPLHDVNGDLPFDWILGGSACPLFSNKPKELKVGRNSQAKHAGEQML